MSSSSGDEGDSQRRRFFGLMIYFFIVTRIHRQGVDERPVSSLPGPTEPQELTGAAMKIEALANSEVVKVMIHPITDRYKAIP